MDGAEKVVGILLEGEKYELAARGSSNSLRARSNREEASLRQSGGAGAAGREGGGVTARGGCFACSHPRSAVLFKKLASPLPRLEFPPTSLYRTARNRSVASRKQPRERFVRDIHMHINDVLYLKQN